MAIEKKYKSFQSFYPYYLTGHADATNRVLHFMVTLGLLAILIVAIVLQKWWMLALIPVCGYGFAWVGHFFIEKNRPATFTYPMFSLARDFVMFWHILTGQLNKKMAEAKRTIN